MKTIPALITALLLFCVGCTTPLPADFQVTPVDDTVVGNNPMVHQKGTLIVDPNGEPFKLRGVLLEGWLQWNGPLWGGGLTSETTISNKLEQLAGAGEFQAFRKGIYDNFITERDIEIIAGLGLNVVRVPINHHILESPSGTPDYEAAGWEYLDRLLEWCERHEVYVVLDLHSAPGGQSGVFVADPDEKKLWESEGYQESTVALWRAIASRYKDESIIAGYDLLNEPGFPDPADLIELYLRIINAIREVDPYHMVILEGNLAATDFSIFRQPLSSNQAYSFHTYNFLTDQLDEEQMQKLGEIAETQDVPLWNGEFGAHNATWVAGTIAMFEKPDNHVSGWIFWPWKRVPENPSERWRGLMGIHTTADWDAIRLFVANPFEIEETITRDAALNGMADFLAAIQADELELDQEMGAIISNFEK